MAAKGSNKPQEPPKDNSIHYCRECANQEPYMRWETLTVKDRQPTMGTCQYEEYKVLLSQRACKANFKLRKQEI